MNSEPKYALYTRQRTAPAAGTVVDIANGRERGWNDEWYYLLSIHLGRLGRRTHWFRESEILTGKDAELN